MRSTFKIVIIVIAMFAVTTPIRASWFSEGCFGRHVVFNTAGVNIALDTTTPEEWLKLDITKLKVRFHREQDVIFQGEKIFGTVLLNVANENGRDFTIGITDPKRAVCGDENFKFPKRESKKGDFDPEGKKLGGLRLLGIFRGRAGFFELDTKDLCIGTHMIDVYVRKSGNREKFTEKPVIIRIVQPLPEIIKALQDVSSGELAQYGLVADEPASPPKTEVQQSPPPTQPTPASALIVEKVERPNFPNGIDSMQFGVWKKGKFIVLQDVGAGNFHGSIFVGQTITWTRGEEIILRVKVIRVYPVSKTVKAEITLQGSSPIQLGDKFDISDKEETK